jgi:hypothetical protein
MKMERTVEQRMNVKFWVKLQRSTTFQSPIHGEEIEELPLGPKKPLMSQANIKTMLI